MIHMLSLILPKYSISSTLPIHKISISLNFLISSNKHKSISLQKHNLTSIKSPLNKKNNKLHKNTIFSIPILLKKVKSYNQLESHQVNKSRIKSKINSKDSQFKEILFNVNFGVKSLVLKEIIMLFKLIDFHQNSISTSHQEVKNLEKVSIITHFSYQMIFITLNGNNYLQFQFNK